MARRAGPSLDRTAVIAAAAELADREGLGGVTLATVAVRLGVQTPSLYNHVAGLPGLRRELALLGLRELGQRMGRAAVGKAGASALEAIAHAYRGYAHEHPGVYVAAQQVPANGDAAWEAAGAEVVGIVLAVLAGYDLEGDDALHATRGLRSLLHGFVSLETGGGFGLPLDLDESFRRLLQVFMAGLRPLILTTTH